MLEKRGEWKRKNAGKIVAVAIVVLLVLLLIVHFLPVGEKNAESQEDRLAFLASLGWQADPDSEEANQVVIPDCSEGAMAYYNALMQKGGWDLSDYEGKSVGQYQYRLTNYPDCEQTVWVTLYVCRGRVIGGDIHTASLDGFMHELRPNDEKPTG